MYDCTLLHCAARASSVLAGKKIKYNHKNVCDTSYICYIILRFAVTLVTVDLKIFPTGSGLGVLVDPLVVHLLGTIIELNKIH